MGTQVGQALREARLNKGLDLYEAHRVTGIRVEDLRAMEEDRWEAVPKDVAEDLLATYARFLDLDEKSLLVQYTHPGEQEEAPVSPGVIARGSSEPRLHWNRRGVLAVVGVAALVGVIIGLVAIGPLGGSGGSSSDGSKQVAGTSAGSTEPTTATAGSAPVSLQLSPKKVVWVCLVDKGGHPVIPGQDLVANQTVGPYEGKGFDVRFGNGSIDMTVNGQPVDVPPVAAPVGFRITPQGATKLAPADQPTCT
jgi:Helix-turn-helix domain